MEDVDEKFSRLRPVRYNLKEPLGDPTKPQIGLIAEEVQDLFPEFLIYGKDGKTVDGLVFDKMVALTIKEIQTMKLQIQSLVNENTSLKARIEALERSIY